MPDSVYHALPEGSVLDQYEIRGVLGAGGFGITYLGWDQRLERKVAIKEYLPNDLALRKRDGISVIAKSGSDNENFSYGMDRFLSEARTLAKFKEPNIIGVANFLQANGTAYMVMDYEEGEPLSALLEREGALDEATLKTLMIPILDGLRAVHREQFLHRDIKPGNIYLRSEGSPVLLDFGAARQALGEHSRSMTGIVTAGYAPFEQYSSRGKQGPWTDLYAIGATMYRAISGHPPVESSERVAAVGEGDADPLVPATEIGKGRYSDPLLSSIDWMLNLAAKDRPQSVEAVLDRLLGRSSTHPASPPMHPPKSVEPSPPPTTPPAQPKKSKAGALGIGVLVLVLLGFGTWAYMNGDNETQGQPAPPITTTISPTTPQPQSANRVKQPEQPATVIEPSATPPVKEAVPQPVEPPPALVGHLQINVNVADAKIHLDGQPVGTASPSKPLNLEGLQLGTHKIEVEATGYQPLSQPTQVEAQQWTQLALQLEPVITTGELIIRSNVSGDTVYIDGKAVGPTGKTPHSLAAGEYTIRVEKPGYESWEQSAQLKAGEQQVLRVELQPKSGELAINIDPPSATVRIDGQPVGGAGTYKLRAGAHRVRIEATGYKPYERQVTVNPGQQERLSARLVANEPESGELTIRVEPAGARVRIDGQPVGGVGTYKLRAGTHRVRIEKTGYKPYERQVTVNPGQQETLRARLVANEPEMVAIPGGNFEMGSPSSEEGRDDDERQYYRVRVNRFKMAKTEVTQAQWEAVMGNNPSSFKGCATCPVEEVSWQDVQSYINKLNQRTGKRYRLPTEAEWEYACRGGRAGERYCGGNNVDRLAWYGENSDGKTHPVGQKQPNGYGLYDMSGNVREWTCSAYDSLYGGDEERCARKNRDANRSIRGGSWHDEPQWVRSANRHGLWPTLEFYDLGFRLAQD